MQHRLSIIFILLINCFHHLPGQDRPVFSGQLSLAASYAPDNDLPFLVGGRYLPEVSYGIPLDSANTLDFLASGNIFGNVAFDAFDAANTVEDIRSYRIWARLTGNRYEVRVGLQKIDFGVATVLRPLQWFNQVDPRDPLGITNGVYGALGRYYFQNNANVWIWVLHGNDDVKGFELIKTNRSLPEIGGRIQYPVPKGELGLTYHYRVADSRGFLEPFQHERIPENRVGLDVKWDVEIGLWLEASHIHKSKNIGIFTHQTLFNLGADYTLGLGNGLNVVLEHLVATSDQQALHFENVSNTTAFTVSYPLGFFDRLNAVATHNWEAHEGAYFLNYEHQFNKFSGYVMAFYNPDQAFGLLARDMDFSLSGPGVRLMLVYNH